MENYLTEMLAGAALVAVIVREFTSMLSLHKNISEVKKVMSKVHRLSEEIHDWHDKDDANGVKIWYLGSTKEAIISLTSKMEKTNDLLSSLVSEIKTDRKK